MTFHDNHDVFPRPTGPSPQPLLPPPAPDDRPIRIRDHRRRARFGLGLATGVALSAAAVGGFVVGTNRATTDSPPVARESAGGVPEAQLASLSSVADIVEQARPSIVSIHQTITQQDPFGNTQTGEAAGTGFVLSADGYIVTNSHVVAEGDETTVDFDDGTSLPAEIVAASPSFDLAVLKVERSDLVPLPIGDSGELRIGDELVAVGYALDLTGEPSVTTGILSATDRSLTEPNGERLVDLLQTDTAINPGNSGGPLLNPAGEVIGINTAIAGQAQNIGFAISIDHAVPLIAELRDGTVPELALLGVSTQPTETGPAGAEVVDVQADSAAATAGLEVGDIITAIAGEPVDGPEALGVEVAGHRPGDRIEVSVIRDGATLELSAVLGSRST